MAITSLSSSTDVYVESIAGTGLSSSTIDFLDAISNQTLSSSQDTILDFIVTHNLSSSNDFFLDFIVTHNLSSSIDFIFTRALIYLRGKQIDTGAIPVNTLETESNVTGSVPVVSDPLGGTSHVAFSGMVGQRLSSISGINTLSPTSTLLYTVPTGKTAQIYGVVVRCTAASAITNDVSIRVDNITTADVVPVLSLSNLRAVGDTWNSPPTGKKKLAAAASTITLVVTTAAIGTSQTVAVDLIGYLI